MFAQLTLEGATHTNTFNMFLHTWPQKNEITRVTDDHRSLCLVQYNFFPIHVENRGENINTKASHTTTLYTKHDVNDSENNVNVYLYPQMDYLYPFFYPIYPFE